MSSYISVELRNSLLAADDHQCAYCQTRQSNSGFPMVVDHIIPVSKNGPTAFENLCFSCHRCNLFKNERTHHQDPLTGNLTALFHPRRDSWADHFRWDEDGIFLTAITGVGRATLLALQMNNDVIIDARRKWVAVGWHP